MNLDSLRESCELPTQFIEGAHKSRVCVYVFVEVSVCALWVSMLYYVILNKNELPGGQLKVEQREYSVP